MREKKSLPVVTVRLKTERRLIGETTINTPEKAMELIRRELGDMAREVVMALYLDTAGHPIAVGLISAGTMDQTSVSAVQIFQTALLCNSRSIIFFHNHPSQNLTASNEDIQMTRTMIACGDLLGVRVLDHIIVGGDKYMSMKENGTVDFEPKMTLDERIKESGIYQR